MPLDFGGTLNQVESRLSRLEQNSVTSTTGIPDLSYDEETATTAIDDHLDWTANPSGWEPYSTYSPFVVDVATNEITDGGELSSPYGVPQAHMVGSMCVLTGVVRRKAGAVPATLTAGQRWNSPMFGLPDHWRPTTNIILPCLMGNTAPDGTTSGVVGTAWIEIRPDTEPMQVSGRVHFIAGTVALTPGTGWIALQGIFPCNLMDTTTVMPETNSWDGAHFQKTWDSLDSSVTWNTYTGTE